MNKVEFGCLRVAPSPEVQRAIREEIDARKLSTHDLKLMSVVESLGAEPSTSYGINSGIFYPEDAIPISPQAMSLAPAEQVRGRPTTGAIKCLVLLVDFPDQKGARSVGEFQDMLFANAKPNNRSLRDFYVENSFNQLQVDGQVVGWLTLPQNYSYYVGQSNGMGAYPHNSQRMVEDALNAAIKAGVDLSKFDADGDGYVDGLFVVHSGGGAEAETNKTNRAKKIWSHQWFLQKPFVQNNTTAYSYCTEPEDGRVGVFCHEFGHMLGLPDLYDTSNRSEAVGLWCVMGSGSWNDSGNTPGHFCAWAKYKLGWLKPNVVSSPQTLTLNSIQRDQNAAYRLWTKGNVSKEYFLFENRQLVGFDASLPAGGLLIWHIDENQKDNTHPAHYMVGLEQADGRRDLELGSNRGDGGDPYPGTKKNTKFDDSSSPDSDDATGKPTGVAAEDIVLVGSKISCKVTV